MSCTPGEVSATRVRIGRLRSVRNGSPTAGNSRFVAARVCAALWCSLPCWSPSTNAKTSPTCPPVTSTTRTSSPARTRTARPVPPGTSMRRVIVSLCMPPPNLRTGRRGDGGISTEPPAHRVKHRGDSWPGSVTFRCDARGVYETESELRDLQNLMDASLSRSTAHLRSIVTGERSLGADQLVRVLSGMCVLALSTVTAAGEPRVSAVDGHFLHGRWVFGTARGAAKARHLRARPAASVAHLRGEDLGVF